MNSIKSLLNKILSKFGYMIVDKNKWRPKHNFEYLDLPANIKQQILKNTMLSEICLINILSVSEYLVKNQVQGDYVECGVWKGGSVALMAYFLNCKNEIRAIHLFDCFDDICQPDYKIDGERAIKEVGGYEFAKGDLIPVKGMYDNQGGSGNENSVKSLIVEQIGYPANKIFIHKGWFQDTLPKVYQSIEKISLLRLDGDWYSSTKVCLEYLYEKVIVGGVIIVDDYGCYEGCEKAVTEFLQLQNIKPFLIKVDDECIYWIKQ